MASNLGFSSQYDKSLIESMITKSEDGNIIDDINGMILGGGIKGKDGSILGGMLGGK